MTKEEAEKVLSEGGPYEVVLEFARALHEAGLVHGASSLLSYFEKPWHWATEFVRWDECGRPMDFSEAGWQDWLAAHV